MTWQTMSTQPGPPGPPDQHGQRGSDLRWLLTRLVEEVPDVISVAVVSADGLPLLSSEPGQHGPLRRSTVGPGGAVAALRGPRRPPAHPRGPRRAPPGHARAGLS
jgi:hypothetical protein